MRTLFLLLNHRTPISCASKGRINMNQTQHGIPFQISLIHEAPQPSAHTERPASQLSTAPPVRHLPAPHTPEKGQHQSAPQSTPRSPPNLYTALPIPARSLLAPKLGPSRKKHSGAQGGFPVNSTCRTTLLYPSRSHPCTLALSPRGCSVTRSPRQKSEFSISSSGRTLRRS